jgi:hypothetical protein
MSYTLESFPGHLQTELAGSTSSLSVSLTRSTHAPFILLPGIHGTAHGAAAAKNPYLTVLNKTTYDALTVKPLIASIPKSGHLLELSLLWKSGTDATTGVTTAPVVRVFGVMPAPIGHPRRLANAKQIESASWAATPAAPFNLATFMPLMTVASTPSAAAVLPATTAIQYQVVPGEVWGVTEPIQVYLAGADAIVATLETSAVINGTGTTCHLLARVIDA